MPALVLKIFTFGGYLLRSWS